MMTGYWKDDGETARALDPTGWLSTGDVAEIEDGRIFIRGRLREMIVLSIGEKVNPNVVEAELTRDRLFKQVVVVGDRRPFLVAIIVLNADAWRRFAADKGLDPEQPNHAVSKIEVLARDHSASLHLATVCAGSRRAPDIGAVDDRSRATDANAQGKRDVGAGEMLRPARAL